MDLIYGLVFSRNAFSKLQLFLYFVETDVTDSKTLKKKANTIIRNSGFIRETRKFTNRFKQLKTFVRGYDKSEKRCKDRNK